MKPSINGNLDNALQVRRRKCLDPNTHKNNQRKLEECVHVRI